MRRIVLLAIMLLSSSTIVLAYDYEYQRSLQARDSGELLTKPISKDTLSKDEKRIKAIQRKKNLEKRRDKRIRGIRNNQGDIINIR